MMEEIFKDGILFMRPLCGAGGLGWDYKVLDFWLWEVLPMATLLVAFLGAICSACTYFAKSKAIRLTQVVTILNCSMLGLCIAAILTIVGILITQ